MTSNDIKNYLSKLNVADEYRGFDSRFPLNDNFPAHYDLGSFYFIDYSLTYSIIFKQTWCLVIYWFMFTRTFWF